MLEKIKEKLGEELTAQVKEKLGTIELAIMNDGSVVPATKYDALKSEYNLLQGQHKSEIDTLNTKLEDALKTSGDVEAFKKSIEDLKTGQQKTVDEYESKIKNIQIESALEVALTKANSKNPKAVKALLDMEKITIEAGEIKGVEDQLNALVESDSYLFGEIKQAGTNPQVNDTAPQNKRDTFISRYNEAKQNGDTKEAIRIKNEAFKEGEII